MYLPCNVISWIKCTVKYFQNCSCEFFEFWLKYSSFDFAFQTFSLAKTELKALFDVDLYNYHM